MRIGAMPVALRTFLFFLTVGLVTVLGHMYLYRRLFRDTSGHPSWRLAGGGLLALLCLLLLGSRPLVLLHPSEVLIALSRFSWLWMGAATYLLLIMFLLSGLGPLSRWRARRRGTDAGEAAPSEARRQFLARASAGAALVATGGVTSYGVWRAYHPPVVREVAVRLPGLPRALDGFSLVQLSDIHVGPLIQRRFMDALVAQCNGLKPDLVCITGDLVDGTVQELGHAVSALSRLRTRFGTYVVTGNHEYYSGVMDWVEAFERMGLAVLRNRHVRVGEPAASFDLVGVDDWSARSSGFGQGYDLQAATTGRDVSRAAVLLAHQPHGWRAAAAAGLGLQLSGHTHGGQFFPFTLAVSAIWEHDAGLFREGDSHLYVSRGTGFWGPPLRVAAPPEIVKVTLLA